MFRLLLAALLAFVATSARGDDRPLTRIAFGSCADQDKPLPIFDTIAAAKPELLLLMGDNIYADIDHTTGKLIPGEKITKERIAEKYEVLAKLPGYQKLKAGCPILATWDDHDFGKNDAGADWVLKDDAQKLFLDFFGTGPDDPRRKQKGVYAASIIGPPGKRVQVVMLDTRYHRSPLKRAPFDPVARVAAYLPNSDPDATVLGAEQWKWLEGELKKPADVRILVSSIQVVADEHPFEKWSNFPRERDRLFDLLRSTKAAGVVILSGDRHLGEIALDTKTLGYPLYDVTSSGLNQASKTWRAPEKNSRRVAAMPYGDNFGMLLIDWAGDDPRLTLQLRDVDGDTACGVKLPLSTLRPVGDVAVQPKLPDGAIRPAEALKKIGENVTVQFAVGSSRLTGAGEKRRLFLNSDRDFKSKENLTVMLTGKAFAGAWAKADADTFKNKTVRVTGTVKLYQDRPEIEVTDEKQIEVVEN